MDELFRDVLCFCSLSFVTQRCDPCRVWLIFKEKSLFSCRGKLLQRAAPQGSQGRCWGHSHIPHFPGGRVKPEKTPISLPVLDCSPLIPTAATQEG